MEAGSRKILFFTILITLLTLAIVYYSFGTGRSIAERYTPLIDAAMEIKLEATTAHLWFEEAISGDRTVDIEMIWSHLDQSEWYAQAMLDGGINEEGTFVSLDEPDLRIQIKETIEGIHHFRQIAQQRWDAQSTSGIGSELDQQFDQAFLEFTLSADDVETALQKVLVEELQTFKFTEKLLMTLILILGGVIGGLLLRYNTKQNKSMLVLHKQEESTRITLNSIGDAVIVTDTHSLVTFMNPVAIQLTGWTPEQAVGQPLNKVFNIVHAHTLNPADNPVKKVMETGEIVGLANHTMLIAKDGTEYQIADSGSPTRSPDGSITGVVLVFRDISNEYAQHEELKKSESRLQDAIWATGAGTYEWYVQTGELIVNKQWAEIVGYSLEELEPITLDTWDKLIHLDDSKHAEELINRCISQEADSYECEVRLRHKQGHWVWILDRGRVSEWSDDGKAVRMSGTHADITKRKLAEEALAESAEKLRLSAQRLKLYNEQTPLATIEWDVGFEILDWNNQAEHMFGYTLEEVKGRYFVDFMLPDNAIVDIKQLWKDLISESGGTSSINENLTKDGRIILCEWHNTVIKDETGKVIGAASIILDITDRKQAENKLRKSEQEINLILKTVPNMVWLKDKEGIYLNCNAMFERFFGAKKAEIIGKTDYDFVDVELADFFRQHDKTAMEANQATVNEEWLDFADGGHRILSETTKTPFKDESGNIIGVLGVAHDITDRKLAEQKLQLAAKVFTHAREDIAITDVKGTIIDVNDTFTETTGYSREEAIGQNPRILQSGRQSPEFYSDMWQALLEEGYWYGELWNRRKNGEVYAEMKTISAVRDEQGVTTHYVALGSDITPMKEHQEQLERIARYDILTNLPNRSLLADRLSQAMLQCKRHQQSLAVVFLDLDYFKEVNDSHGHDVGDELLIALSLRMKEALREGDTLARIGGDEFVAILADLAKVEDCEPVLERFLLAASEPVTIGEVILNVSASIGVTLYPQDNVDADQLMRHADQAMYVAKESGKNRYHLFDTIQDDAVKVQRESLEAIRNALDNHQFVLHYQPKVNMKTGTVTGVEALIRWQHPERGLLNPLEFLPVIENHAMMIEMGEWVIDTALTQISQWQEVGINLPISTSVNIAAVQLQQSDFTDRLTALLAAHPDVEPHYLELEVLETSALEDVLHVSEIMNACMALGVNFSLDDFGTGYSSLTYLRRLPASLIKIDQTFVRDMLVDPDDLAIVEGVIGLAKSFKRDVIAEGVETIEHGTTLLKLGCDLAQGYGIARPMPASDIPAWVDGWKPDDAWQL